MVVFFNPRAVDSTNRSHTVESSYLAEHSTGTSFCVPEEDVEKWLSLEKPALDLVANISLPQARKAAKPGAKQLRRRGSGLLYIPAQGREIRG